MHKSTIIKNEDNTENSLGMCVSTLFSLLGYTYLNLFEVCKRFLTEFNLFSGRVEVDPREDCAT